MKFTVIHNPKYTYLKVGISVEPDNRVLRLFLGLVNPEKMPELIMSVAESREFGAQNATLKFYHEMDWEDKAGLNIKEGEISIYVYDGAPNDTVVNENEFDRIIYEYSLEAIKVYGDDPSLPPDWKNEMNIALSSLMKKIR